MTKKEALAQKKILDESAAIKIKEREEQTKREFRCFWTWPFGHVWARISNRTIEMKEYECIHCKKLKWSIF